MTGRCRIPLLFLCYPENSSVNSAARSAVIPLLSRPRVARK